MCIVNSIRQTKFYNDLISYINLNEITLNKEVTIEEADVTFTNVNDAVTGYFIYPDMDSYGNYIDKDCDYYSIDFVFRDNTLTLYYDNDVILIKDYNNV